MRAWPPSRGSASNSVVNVAPSNLDNTPAARVPYSTIGGIAPIWDIQGGIGDFLNGGLNAANEPYYGTYRGIVGLT